MRARVPPRLLYRAVTRLRPSSSALRKYSESSGPAQAQLNHAGQAVAPNTYRGHCGRCHSLYHIHVHSIDALITAPFPARTHTCAQLSAEHAGSRVVLTGWLLPPRCVLSQQRNLPHSGCNADRLSKFLSIRKISIQKGRKGLLLLPTQGSLWHSPARGTIRC